MEDVTAARPPAGPRSPSLHLGGVAWGPVYRIAALPGEIPIASPMGLFHRKMKEIHRRAYGFRNFESYLLRAITQYG